MREMLRRWLLGDVDQAARQAERDGHLQATLEQLAIIRVQFTEAISFGEVFKTDGDRAAIRATAYNILSAENHIRRAMGQKVDAQAPGRGAGAVPRDAEARPEAGVLDRGAG